jgi:hypothetical protein
MKRVGSLLEPAPSSMAIPKSQRYGSSLPKSVFLMTLNVFRST